MSDAQPPGIDYFNRGHWLTAIQNRVSLAARRRMFGIWRRYAGTIARQSVLDIGATPDHERIDSNCMLPWFHEAGLTVTLYSPEDIRNLIEIFPWAHILPSQGFGAPIPAADRAYQWVTSSAVLEHVGGVTEQMAFIRELARVSDGVFLTTPNRHHWFEFHTKLPVLHWLPRHWHRAALRALGHTLWAQESHLRLLSAVELRTVAELAMGAEFTINIKHIWTFGMPSNLILLAKRRI